MAAGKSSQKRTSAPPAASNGRSAVIWGSLAFCSILAVCGLIAFRMGATDNSLMTARVSTTPPPSQPIIQKPQAASEFEVARLNDAIRTLAAERDRLAARVETLEQSVGDITASINNAKKPEPAITAAAEKPLAAAEEPAAPKPEKPVAAISEKPAPPIAEKPVLEKKAEEKAAEEKKAAAENLEKQKEEEQKAATAAPEKPVAAINAPAANPAPQVAEAAPPQARAEFSSPTPQQPREQKYFPSAAPVQNPFLTAMNALIYGENKNNEKQATQRQIAHTTSPVGRVERPGHIPRTASTKTPNHQYRAKTAKVENGIVPTPPIRPQAAKGKEPATQVAQVLPNQTVPQGDVTGATRTEFGVDLGGETSLDGLRARWSKIRGHHGSALQGLHPLVRVREGSRPGTVELHLIAGPFSNAGTAARVCAQLQSSGVACKASEFDGQRLSIR